MGSWKSWYNKPSNSNTHQKGDYRGEKQKEEKEKYTTEKKEEKGETYQGRGGNWKGPNGGWSEISPFKQFMAQAKTKRDGTKAVPTNWIQCPRYNHPQGCKFNADNNCRYSHSPESEAVFQYDRNKSVQENLNRWNDWTDQSRKKESEEAKAQNGK